MKNKLLFLLICFLLTGCGNYRELNNIAIVTAVGIDKKEDKYELSFLIANSQKAQTSTKEGEAQTTVYSGKGKTLTEASEHIAYKSPKKLYYGHINVVIISEDVAKDNFLKVADYLIRYPESRKKFFLMQTKDNPKDVLKIVSPLESFPSQSIATLLKSTKDTEGVIDVVDYSTFIGKILEEGFDPVLPVLSIKGNQEKGNKSENIESTEPEAYIKLDSVAIFRGGKFLGYENFKVGKAINIINNNVNEFKNNFKYKKKPVGSYCDFVSTKIKVKKFNKVSVKVDGKCFISEINSKTDLENPKTVKKMEQALNKSLKKQLQNTILDMQNKYHSDVFGFGNKIYKKYPNWKNIKDNWNDVYFHRLNIEIKTCLKIYSSGSLDRTIKEVLS